MFRRNIATASIFKALQSRIPASIYRMGHEKVARLPFARVLVIFSLWALVIFSLALVYCVE
jgi:hypothetical protein